MTAEAPPGAEAEQDFDEPVEVGFGDLDLLTDEGVEVFVLPLNDRVAPPPYYITAAGQSFHYGGETFLVQGRGAELPRFLAERDGEGILVLLVERLGRYLAYLHDPAEEAEDEDESEGAEG